MSGSAFHWFRSYLDNRRQYVTCNSTESKSLALRHGVPQGSVLGPTLFCTHYNDVTSAVKHSSMRTILEANRTSCTQSMRSKLGLLTLKNRRRFLRFQLVYKIINDYNCPNQLKSYLPRRSSLHGRDLRDNTMLHLPKANTTAGQKTFQYAAAKDWNDLPKSIRSITTFSSFKAALYRFFAKIGQIKS